ncbi:spore coat protein [Salsuginibacillus kocurii]|uniref:spore coat protein n=1 Tax=Salsuginibacillus kocurii TaxID=427078 RepID=UPI00037D5FEA|nr:spore coat protein [Salsuginibacillus kocurii]
MNKIVEQLTGMNKLTDQVLAMDLLIASKSGVRNYALAVTETVSPEVKAVLTQQLNDALELHEQIATYLEEQKLYHPYDVDAQTHLTLENIQTAVELQSPSDS